MKSETTNVLKRFAAGLAVMIWILQMPVFVQAQDDERPDVHAEFEFTSFPWSTEAFETFSNERVRLLMAAFDEGWSLDKFIEETESDLISTLMLLDRLEEARLVSGQDDYDMRPRLLVIREEEIERLRPAVETDSAELLGIVESHWEEIEEFVGTLDAASNRPRDEILYQVVVGGLFLGGVLDALYEEQTLLPGPPRRGRQGERYYAWMIEVGTAAPPVVQQAARVGRYEVRSIGLIPEENPRIQIDEVARTGPVYESEDSNRWRVFASVFSRDYLVPYIESRRSEFIELGGEIEASRYTALGEFFAWYYNAVVTDVAERLVETGRVTMPEASYRYALRSVR